MIDNRVWSKYTRDEAAELIKKDPVVVIPVGSHEQHGPHLTLNTDTDIAFNISKGAMEKVKVSCSVIPPIYVGISEHHMNYSGSLTLKPETLRLVVNDIVHSLYRHGVRKVLLVNAHGGNQSILGSTVDWLGSQLEGNYVLVSYWSLVSENMYKITHVKPGAADHAGELETALKMYLSPEDVRKDLIVKGEAVGNDYWKPEAMSNKISTFKAFDSFTKHGHIGDPTKSTAEMGEKAFELITDELAKLIEAMHKQRL
jgi:creatinine amidohydrolase